MHSQSSCVRRVRVRARSGLANAPCPRASGEAGNFATALQRILRSPYMMGPGWQLKAPNLDQREPLREDVLPARSAVAAGKCSPGGGVAYSSAFIRGRCVLEAKRPKGSSKNLYYEETVINAAVTLTGPGSGESGGGEDEHLGSAQILLSASTIHDKLDNSTFVLRGGSEACQGRAGGGGAYKVLGGGRGFSSWRLRGSGTGASPRRGGRASRR